VSLAQIALRTIKVIILKFDLDPIVPKPAIRYSQNLTTRKNTISLSLVEVAQKATKELFECKAFTIDCSSMLLTIQ